MHVMDSQYWFQQWKVNTFSIVTIFQFHFYANCNFTIVITGSILHNWFWYINLFKIDAIPWFQMTSPVCFSHYFHIFQLPVNHHSRKILYKPKFEFQSTWSDWRSCSSNASSSRRQVSGVTLIFSNATIPLNKH